ncbi:MAG: YeiH family protein [Desulfitobacteriia bacterium]|jgi:uncharacterized integral membrane protein (TIGR00698 family)
MLRRLKTIVPGLFLCLILAVPAFLLGQTFPLIGGPVFGILFGMVITITRNKPSLTAGINFTSKKLLQYAIIFLGFEMNLFHVIRVGAQSLLIIVSTLSAAFLTAFLVGRYLHLNGKMTTLIGVGTSICGGSAIAATAPVIQAKDKDIAQAISTIFLFNIAAVFIFPALGHFLGMSDLGFGIWAGTAINDTSSVVAAAASWSTLANNNTALALATIVKLTRTLMIVPITLALAIYTVRRSPGSQSGRSFRLTKVFPWFVIGFILAAVINTFVGLPGSVSDFFVASGKFLIIMAMAAIGLNTDLKKLLLNGLKPITLGLSCWLAVAGVSLLVQKILALW